SIESRALRVAPERLFLLPLSGQPPLLLPVLDREDGRPELARDLRDGLAALLHRALHGGLYIRAVARTARAHRRTSAALAGEAAAGLCRVQSAAQSIRSVWQQFQDELIDRLEAYPGRQCRELFGGASLDSFLGRLTTTLES